MSDWELMKSSFPAAFAGQGVLNKDPNVWLDGARLPLLVLLVPLMPENEIGIVII